MNLVTNGVAMDVVRGVATQLIQNFALGYLAQTVFLFAALLIMVKLQKLNCHPLALLGSAALACALDYIPFVGIELSALALLLCITKAIGARTFTDAVFTVGISYALTLCFNLFVLSMLLGNLRHSVSVPVRARTAGPTVFDTPATTNSPGDTNRLIGVGYSDSPASNAAEDLTSTASVRRGARSGATNLIDAGKLASDVATHFTIRGISKGAVQTIAMIGNGSHTYDVAAGDTFQMTTASGKANVVCDSVEESKVVLEVEGVKVTIQHKQAAAAGTVEIQ